MDKSVFIASAITIIFLAFKCMEYKYIEYEFPPLKYIIRDLFMAFIASMIALTVGNMMGGQLGDMFNVMTDAKVVNAVTTQIFTDEPGF